MIIQYLEGSFSEEDLSIIKESNPDIEIDFASKKPCITNAALDVLVGEVIIFFNSTEVTAIIHSLELAGLVFTTIKTIIKCAKKKQVTILSTSAQNVKHMNVIIQVDNVKILEPDNPESISLNDYLSLALVAVTSPSMPKDRDIIISYDNDIYVETIDQYARRKMKL